LYITLLLPFLLNCLFKSSLQNHGISLFNLLCLYYMHACMHPMYLTVFKFSECHLFSSSSARRKIMLIGMWSGYMQQEEKAVLVDGKVDWKGRRALKHKHGGWKFHCSYLIRKLGLRQIEFMHIFLKINMHEHVTTLINYMVWVRARNMNIHFFHSFSLFSFWSHRSQKWWHGNH